VAHVDASSLVSGDDYGVEGPALRSEKRAKVGIVPVKRAGFAFRHHRHLDESRPFGVFGEPDAELGESRWPGLYKFEI
jgi:hypothetical protein